ncbi:MAG: T9SS type A sorting domain-containing protein [Flavobacteriia bacterium]|nr:T9SS type A sorting domain-containing protein [Flavobacteriia bacterium]
MLQLKYVSYLKNNMKSIILFLSIQLIINEGITVFSQCPVVAYANPSTVVCGNNVTLTAVADGCKPLNNNFNDGTIDDGGAQPWGSTNGAQVQNGTGTHACVGPPSEGAYSLWMGTTVAAPRQITTNNYDMTQCGATSATLCFDMKYGTQGASSPCEGIDLPDEGIYIQYSINNGASWVNIGYFDPNGGYDPNLTSWRTYCFSLPPAALTTATKFRWYQSTSSGAGFDAWGLDNMVLNLNVPGYTFDWAHDAQGPSASPDTPVLQVTSNGTYTVTYTNGVENCTASVNVTVLGPSATASATPTTVCANGATQLLATSSINMEPPGACGPVASVACTPFSSIADEQQVGAGVTTIAYNTGGENVFGNFGDAYQTAQILFRASELTSAGMVAGKINSIVFDIQRIETSGGGTVSSLVYPNVKISLGCTSASTLSTLLTGLSQVYSGTNVSVSTGWSPFFFTQGYNWDGTSNLVVQVCWYFPNGAASQDAPPNGTDNYYAFCRYNSPGYNCYRYSGTNFSPGTCATNDFVSYVNRRPNVKFGFCKPNNAPLTFSWTSVPAGFTSTLKNPTANPAVATTYNVAVNQTGMPAACAATSSVSVTTITPTVSINPNPAQICAPATSVNLVASGSTNVGINAPKTFSNTSAGALTDGTALCGGTTTFIRDITVTGANPTTLASNPIQSIVLNMTNPNNGDIQARLRDPAGNWYTLITGGSLSGANLTNTTFSPTASTPIASGSAPYNGTFLPSGSLPSAGNVNGTWRLELIDQCKPGIGSSISNFSNWSIKFNAPNEIVSYLWTPSTNLSSTTTANTSSNTSSDRTYTCTVTDSKGCTGSQQVTVYVGCSLPISLTQFDTYCENEQVVLKWDIESQNNNDYFMIEKSFDGLYFKEIARVKGELNSNSPMSYQSVDEDKINRECYYRLKQVDIDGKSTIYETLRYIPCLNSEEVCVDCYPNPNNGELNFMVNKRKLCDDTKLKIYDITGKIVYEVDLNSKALINNIYQFSLPKQIQNGTYLMEIDNCEIKLCNKKVVLMR